MNWINHSKATKTSNLNIYRLKKVSNQEKNINNIRNIKIKKREGKSSEDRSSTKSFYKSSNNFYNNDRNDGYTFNEGNKNIYLFGRKLYSNSNNSINSINKDSNSNTNNMNVDSEIDYVKYIPSQKSSQYILNDHFLEKI